MNQPAKPSQRFRHLVAAIAACAMVACTGAEETGPPVEPPLAGASIGGEFELTSSTGETVRWGDFAGQYRIVYFGFTYCPDICPTDMQRMAQGLKKLGEEQPEMAAKIQPIFISIDPERDTPEIVGEFTSAFGDNIVGLTGTPEQIKAAADAFRVYYERGEDTPDGTYLMNHSNIVYLFGPTGNPLATLPTDKGAEAVAAEIEKWMS
ncbi:MAG: SCO family protein [Erythrobacter sp.]|nr:SCO family protein [Erythrobacter sp.]